jgi:hypothetical protein
VTLADLALAPVGSNQGFISPDLALDPSRKSGYDVSLAADASVGVVVQTLAANTCNTAANDAMSGYWAGAVPATVGQTGQRAFATDTRGTIFLDMTGAAVANPIPLAANIL